MRLFSGLPTCWHVCFLAVLLTGCEQFEFSPYQTKQGGKEHIGLNATNISRLQARTPGDTIVLVFSGDQQRFYYQVDRMVDDINDLQQVDAVFLVGDLTDFGLIREFGWLNESLLRLQCPFIAVIGNHDCLANGTELFERTYGPLNQHFDWAGIRFVLHNTNSREFSFNGQVPDINWMRSVVEDTSAYRASVFVSHIKPFDIGDFDAALEDAYVQVLRSARSPLFSVHGHDHISNSVTPYGSDLHFHVAGSPSYSSYALVKIFTLDDGTISYTLSRRTF